MKVTSANIENEARKYFLAEKITVAITRCGKITQDTFPLLRDKDGKLYFEFGMFYENKISVDDFKEVL